MMKKSGLTWLWLSAVVFVLDQASKLFVRQHLHEFQSIDIMPSLNFTLAFNQGAAFSFLSDESGWQRWFFIGVTMVIGALLLWWLHKTQKQQKLQAVGFSLILGGAAGNVLDRIIHGSVTDFIDFYIGSWHWYTFNVADIAITLGVASLLIDILFYGHKHSKP